MRESAWGAHVAPGRCCFLWHCALVLPSSWPTRRRRERRLPCARRPYAAENVFSLLEHGLTHGARGRWRKRQDLAWSRRWAVLMPAERIAACGLSKPFGAHGGMDCGAGNTAGFYLCSESRALKDRARGSPELDEDWPKLDILRMRCAVGQEGRGARVSPCTSQHVSCLTQTLGSHPPLQLRPVLPLA